jgi:hypothetical protein
VIDGADAARFTAYLGAAALGHPQVALVGRTSRSDGRHPDGGSNPESVGCPAFEIT